VSSQNDDTRGKVDAQPHKIKNFGLKEGRTIEMLKSLRRSVVPSEFEIAKEIITIEYFHEVETITFYF
jgi:hypothetical protein